MPKNKDLKRLVRRRMQKTQESYTAARARLLEKESKSKPPPEDHARLAGMSDAAVEKKTGCTWAGWVRALDRVGAADMSHKDIAKHVGDKYPVTGWWAQTVTVGYERIRGLREIGQRRGGTYDANKSKTFPVPIAKLYRAFSEKRVRVRWLPDVDLKIRTSSREKSMRITWGDGTSVDAHFTAKGPSKSQVAIQHRKLPSQAMLQSMKDYWGERLGALSELLNGSRK